VAGSCEHGNEFLDFIKGGGLLSDYQLLMKDSVPWSQLVSYET